MGRDNLEKGLRIEPVEHTPVVVSDDRHSDRHDRPGHMPDDDRDGVRPVDIVPHHLLDFHVHEPAQEGERAE